MLNQTKIKKQDAPKTNVKVKNRIKDIVYEGPLAQYLMEIDRVKLLTREEEEYLAKRAFNNNQEAREKLIKANLRFVVNIAKKYQKRGLPLIDLINEGNMGLITASDKFDYRKGYHFISYAVWWIKQSILKALSEKTRLIRLPLNRANQLMQIERYKKEKDQTRGGDVSSDEIALALDIEEGSVNDIINASREYISFDAPIMFDKKERFLSEILKDTNFKEPEDRLIDGSLKEAIFIALETLTAKEQTVIKYRYGLESNEPMSLKEIGKKFNLTKERIRQIEKKAIRRLRHPSRSDALKAFLTN